MTLTSADAEIAWAPAPKFDPAILKDAGPGDGAAAERRRDVDGLRALAVAAVVLYHIDDSLVPGGFTGVDIFFVISGYVVTKSALQHSEGVKDFVFGFYSRRVVRLYPSFLLVLWSSVMMASVVFPPFMHNLPQQYYTAMASLVASSNVYLEHQEKSYFDLGLKDYDVLKHTWSLAVEEQFYVVFPIVVCLSAYGHAKLTQYGRTPVWAFLALKSLIVCGIYTAFFSKCAYFSLLARAWELAAGVLLAETEGEWRDAVEKNLGARVALQLGALVSFAVAFAFTPHSAEGSGFPFPWALLPVAGAACFISAGVSQASYINSIFASPLPVYIGALSYVIYLWHWPMVVLWQLTAGDPRPWWTVGYLLLGLAAVSVLTHKFVEQPFLRARHRWRPSQVFSALLFASAVSFLYVWILQGPFYGKLWIGNLEHASLVDITTDIGRRGKKTSLLGGTNMTGPQCACKASSSSTFSTLYKPKGAVDAADTRPCFYSDSQNPRLADQLSHKCHTWCDKKARGERPLSTTELQDLGKECLAYEGTSRVVYLIGDSHAAMMADSIKEAVKGKYVVRSWTTGCYCGFGIMCEHPEQDRPEIAPNDVERQNIRLQAGMKADACSTFLHQIKAILKERVRAGDIVAFAQRARLYRNLSPPCKDNALGLLREIGDIATSKDASMMLYSDDALIGNVGYQCLPSMLNRQADKMCDIAQQTVKHQIEDWHGALRTLSRERKGIYFYDYSSVLCTNEKCGAFIPGAQAHDKSTLIYNDAEHLTKFGSLLLWPDMCDFMDSHGFFAGADTARPGAASLGASHVEVNVTASAKPTLTKFSERQRGLRLATWDD